MTTPRRALIVVDVQQEYFDGILQIQSPDRGQALANILAALDVADREDLPVVVVRHELPEGAPVFAVGSHSWLLHPEIERRLKPSWKRVTKDKSSVFASTDVAEELGLAAEILSDASGAIHLANEAGKVSADQLHQTLLVLLQSNFAAVATTEAWTDAVAAQKPLAKSDLGTSDIQRRAAFAG